MPIFGPSSPTPPNLSAQPSPVVRPPGPQTHPWRFRVVHEAAFPDACGTMNTLHCYERFRVARLGVRPPLSHSHTFS
jgi:hypothetical protein